MSGFCELKEQRETVELENGSLRHLMVTVVMRDTPDYIIYDGFLGKGTCHFSS